MTRGLWLNPFSGIAGDMFIGALIDLGLPLDELEKRLASIPLGNYRLTAETVMRGALRATKFDVLVTTHDGKERREARGERPGDVDAGGHVHVHDDVHVHEHEHGIGHGGEHGMSYREILGVIGASGLSEGVKSGAAEVFGSLARAEARMHGVEVEDVHFHEVGAVDSIVDICGALVAVEMLGVDEIVSTPVSVGCGTVKTAHGELPLPAPATAEILAGLPVRVTKVTDELVTPTGAALVRHLVSRFEPDMNARFLATGYGAGSTRRSDPPNVLRAVLYERDESPSEETDTVVVLETQVDDATPESLGHARRRLEEAGALDVLIAPVAMKKDRPGHAVTVIGRPGDADRLSEVLFRETPTFGLRRSTAHREILDRELVDVETPWGPVRVKVGRRHGEVVQVSPEFEDCAATAERAGVPLDEVMRSALSSWRH